MMKLLLLLATGLLASAPALATTQSPRQVQTDPVVRRIIELGRTDNQVMTWVDYATNRFGGRMTGSDAYNNATAWAAWQFRQWGIDCELDEVGEVPVGFNRGPWFGEVVAPIQKSLRFGTPSFTAGTKGLQRGGVVVLQADPFSIPGRRPSPEDVQRKKVAVEAAIAEVRAAPSAFRGAWVLIAGKNTGFARDGRRDSPEYSDSRLMPPLTRALLEAGALGTIQSSGDPIQIMDGFVSSWDSLPELPDIKLLDEQYDEIRSMVEKGIAVELEFDIRNWFKMGPVKYHNVVATMTGSEYPDQYVVLGGHFDSFDGGTGGVDDGSGFSPMMEALRLIKKAGGMPKRSIIVILFAAEEMGLVGSQAWLRKRPEMHEKIAVMINRDGAPSAIVGASVPAAWYEDFQQITAPLVDLDSRWPFELTRDDYPRLQPTRPGGTDSVSFAMQGIPTLSVRNQTDYSYRRAWHTLYDLYSELVPYTGHQQHSALATAVIAYGIANLDRPLPRTGVYLPDGLFAEIRMASGARLIATLDYQNAPLQTANFIRIVEGDPARATAGGRGPRGGGPAIGRVVEVGEGLVEAVIDSEAQRSVAVEELPLGANPAMRHDGSGVLGLSGPSSFYLTQAPKPALDRSCTALGRVIAGADCLVDLAAGDDIRRVRILRSGAAARAFATDDEAFRKLLEAARAR